MDQILNPQFIAQVAILITAIAGLIGIIKGNQATNKQTDTINTIHDNTNSTLADVQDKLTAATVRPAGSRRATDPPPPATQEPHDTGQ